MKIQELEVFDYFEFEGKSYRYWRVEVGDNVFNIAEYALEKALYPDFDTMIPKNQTAEVLDEQICYYASDDEDVEDIRASILGE